MRLYLRAYLKDRTPLFLLHLACMAMLSAFLVLTGYPWEECVIILMCWLAVLGVWLFAVYWDRKRYFREMQQVLDKVDQRYLLGELMPRSAHLEDGIYREMIQKSNKSVIERIRRIEEERQEYREYIESWVHEIKTPITSISLMCENGRIALEETSEEGGFAEMIRRVALENQKVEHFVEMALYYARSDQVYKDYVIRETDLRELAVEAVQKNRYDLRQKQIRVEVECQEETVCTDGKWILFILCQLMVNSIKYSTGENARIRIFTEKQKGGIRMAVEDNGIGIRKEELPRIFEKGFTGTNGHEHRQATGMGLYLCRKLCTKLGIGISAQSEYGKGTTVWLEFPANSYVVKL